MKLINKLQYSMDLDVLFGTSEKQINPNAGTGLKILSCGAGMQSTALALMSCENKVRNNSHPQVPIYDLIVFCDMGWEPPWVYEQVNFIKGACEACGIPFKVLETNLYGDYIEKFGKARVPSIPFWSVDENGKKAKMRRHCTIDKKIIAIQKYVRYEILGYKFKERCRKCDMLQNNRCSIYDVRPRTCRHYPFSAEPCLEEKRIKWLLCTEQAHHFRNGTVTAREWQRKYVSAEEEEFLYEECIILPEIGALLRRIPKDNQFQADIQVIAYRYFAYDYTKPFLPQYKENMLFLRSMLRKLAG